MGRAPCCAKVGLKKGRWTAEEDEILKNYIQVNGEGSWRSLPKNAGLLRCGKSCRLRWINYLRADLKRGNISAEEEGIIINLHSSFGNRWSLIASHMPGRTDNEIKNYWNSHLSRKVCSFRATKSKDDNLPMVLDAPPKRKAGRTSRWAMKKNKTYVRNNKSTTDDKSPKQSVVNTTHQINSEASSSVPLPPQPPTTPALESENLSTLVEDFMVLDPDTEEKIEGEEAPLDESSNSHEKGTQEEKGSALLSDDGLQVEVPVEEGRVEEVNEGSVMCLDAGILGEADEILGACEEVIAGGGALIFNDIIMDTGCILGEVGGVVNFGKERESNSNDVIGDANGAEKAEERGTCTNQMAKSVGPESSVNQSWNGDTGEVYSCSSIANSGLDDISCWDWESVMELNDHNNDEPVSWEHSDNLLTWLWEDDDWEKDFQKFEEDIDPEKQNAMVAWFLS